MVGSASSGFADLVVVSERIENYLKSGKIQGIAAATTSGGKNPYVGFPKKKEGETNVASTARGKGGAYKTPYYQITEVTPNGYQQQAFVIPAGQQPLPYSSPMQYQQLYVPQRHNYYQPGQQRQRKPERKFDVVPIPYSQLLAHLLRGSLIQLRELGTPPNPLPPGYDANARCEFHSSAPGHNVENFKALKHKVQDLIDSKAISFAPNGPNINNNPMPPHVSPSVGMVEESREYSTMVDVDKVKTSLTVVK